MTATNRVLRIDDVIGGEVVFLDAEGRRHTITYPEALILPACETGDCFETADYVVYGHDEPMALCSRCHRTDPD